MPYKDSEKARKYARERAARKQAENPESFRAASKRWRERNPEKQQKACKEDNLTKSDKLELDPLELAA